MAAAAGTGDPVSQVGEALGLEKYVPTQKEADALFRCRSRMRASALKSFVVASGILWSVTGRLKLMQRLVTTFAGGYAAVSLSFQWSWKYCAEEILALDESHLQNKLVAALQKEAIHKPHIRALLEKHYYVEPSYDDSGQTTPGVLLRKREIVKEPEFVEDKTSSSPREVVKSTSPRKEDGPISNDGSSQVEMYHPIGVLLEEQNGPYSNGFKGLVWSEGEESSQLAADGKSTWKHRDRMGVLERRQYNRARYLEWQEKRKANAHENAQVEL